MTLAPIVSALAGDRHLGARLRLAAAGAVTALAAIAPAHAVVVVSPAANLTIPVTTAGLYINVISGATGTAPGAVTGWDLNPWGSTSTQLWASTGGGIVTTGTAIRSLPEGTVVGPASTFTQQGTAASAANGWVFNGNNYFGFSFVNEATGATHYGYGIYALGATFTDPARKIVNIFYESVANTAITIPTAVVPEPGTWAMMLGGLALAGTIARRRKAA